VFLLDEFDQVTANPNFGPDFYFGLRSLAQTGIRFTDREAGQVLVLAGRHPYFAQVTCSLLCEAYHLGLDAAAREGFLADRFQAEAIP
jgi:hypothetical protein